MEDGSSWRMKALIVVLFIGVTSSLAHVGDSCWHANPDNGTNVNEPYIKNVTEILEGQVLSCEIMYRFDKKEGCVLHAYSATTTFSDFVGRFTCFDWYIDKKFGFACSCHYTNCNTDLGQYNDALNEMKVRFEKGAPLSKDKKKLFDCMKKKSKEHRLATTIQTTEITTQYTTTTRTTTVSDALTASTNTTVAATPPALKYSNEEKSSSYLALFIGSAVFNVLALVTVLALIVALVKMKKKGGEPKQGTANIEQKAHQTPTAITIEKPVGSKDSPADPRPVSTTKAADQHEAATDANTTDQDLDTTGGTSGSDSTGPEGTTEVRVSVRGFKRN